MMPTVLIEHHAKHESSSKPSVTKQQTKHEANMNLDSGQETLLRAGRGLPTEKHMETQTYIDTPSKDQDNKTIF
jgi:hypothetical protein